METLDRCPVIVWTMAGDETDRCNERVAVSWHQARDEEGYLGKIRVFAECAVGHSVSQMEKDINLDLDGVPIGA